MQNYMRKHYWEPIGVEDVAKSVGYSPRRCNLLFKTCCGETLGEYLKALRMGDAKRSLNSDTPIDRVALSLSYTPRGFRKAFQEYFGISPSKYAADGNPCGRYASTYEYTPEGLWGTGENPTADGLWEFSCYEPDSSRYVLMDWIDSQGLFLAPSGNLRSSSHWYCRNRNGGFGLHPGHGTHSVKTFCCPESGELEIFYSVGRVYPYDGRWCRVWKTHITPCAVYLCHNGVPLHEPVVLEEIDPVFLQAVCTVRAGDKIQLHVDPLGNHVADGVVLYRQRLSYLNPVEIIRNGDCD